LGTFAETKVPRRAGTKPRILMESFRFLFLRDEQRFVKYDKRSEGIPVSEAPCMLHEDG
jgi:hypothetical protein